MLGLGIDLGLGPRKVGGGSPSFVLDGITTAGAFSVRRLRTAYTGSAIRVRRSSDNVELDIGFTGAGDLDTTALLAHTGANSGFITTWYDQSGNSRNVTQATNASQPLIVNAGVVNLINSRPYMAFDGTAQHLLRTSAFVFAIGSNSQTIVTRSSSPLTDRRAVAEGSSASNNPIYTIIQNASATASQLATFIRNDANTTLFSGVLASGAFSSSPAVITSQDITSAVEGFVNGTSGGSNAYTRSGVLTLDRFAIGALVRTTTASFYPGDISEVIVGPLLGTTDRQFLERNQGAYYGITVA